jgi:hypothetical protein
VSSKKATKIQSLVNFVLEGLHATFHILPIDGRCSGREKLRTFKVWCPQLLTECAFSKDDGRFAQLRGQRAYVEFFTANIRSPNTQRAYARAGGAWCEDCGLTAHDDPAA